jgi:lipoate-protein ligase A
MHLPADRGVRVNRTPGIWIDPDPRPGWQNMAIDLALLDRAETEGLYAWRFYRWEPFCLSFGCHEPATRRYDRERIDALGIDTVRRPTGGRAVWHARELTYAVVAPIEIFGTVRDGYRTIHSILGDALGALGAEPTLAPRRTTPGLGAGACFAVPVGGELVVAGKKVVGSAQRAGPTAFLQHGSMLLDDDQTMVRSVQIGPPAEGPPPEAPLSRLVGRPVSFALAVDAVIAALGAEPPADRSGPTPDSILHQATFHYDRFRSADWTWTR